MAKLFRIPLFIHEQNAVLGRVNRHCAKWAHHLALAFEKTERLPPGVPTEVIGLPLRSGLCAAAHPYEAPGARGIIRLFVVGGSQGARIFSETVPAALHLLPLELQKRLEIVQQVRPEMMGITERNYLGLAVTRLFAPFFPDMTSELNRAHLVIGRAGAGSIFESALFERPTILVPLPTAADGHQLKNAERAAAQGAAWVMTEHQFTPERLAERLVCLLNDPNALPAAAASWAGFAPRDAAERLVEIVCREG